MEDTRVDVTIDDAEEVDKTAKKERPVWLVESTITQNVVLEVSFLSTASARKMVTLDLCLA